MTIKPFDPNTPAEPCGSKATLPLAKGHLPSLPEFGSTAEAVTLEISRSVWERLVTLATQKGTDVRHLASDLLEFALADNGLSRDAPTAAGGYRWKDLTLPAGTELSFKHRGTTYVALVKDGSAWRRPLR